MSPWKHVLLACFLVCFVLTIVGSKRSDTDDKKADEKWKKKDIRDYTEADLERLYEQWEENDDEAEELEEDELPPWKREPKKIDLSNVDMKDPEAILKASKKGKTVMMFVSLSGKADMTETETISAVWHTGLINGNLDTKRYVTDPGRVMFMLDNGEDAWTVKDFLVDQERCADVTIDGKVYPGKGADKKEKQEL